MPERDKCIAPKHWYACVDGVRTDLMPFILDLVPKGPEAVDNAESTPFNTPVTIPVIDNDLPGDFPIDPAATIESSPPSNGSIVVNPDGTIEYTPNTDFHGEDTFSYCIFDTEGNKAIANVVVTVTVNPPTATPDVEVAPFETPITISVVDNDIPGDLSIDPTQTVLSGNPPPASQGTVSVDPVTGEITFTPAVGFSGPVDQFEYCIFDTAGNKAITTVDITVEPENTVVAVDDGPFDLSQGGSVIFDMISNDSDREGDTFAITEIDGQPIANGTFTIGGLTITDNGDGTFSATAPYDQPVAPVVFAYIIEDANGNFDTATVTINLTEVPSGNFVLDGGDGSNISGTTVADAITNGIPFAITDGATGVVQFFEGPTVAEDLQAYIESKDAAIVYNASAHEWYDPNEVCPTVQICLGAYVCGLAATENASDVIMRPPGNAGVGDVLQPGDVFVRNVGPLNSRPHLNHDVQVTFVSNDGIDGTAPADWSIASGGEHTTSSGRSQTYDATFNYKILDVAEETPNGCRPEYTTSLTTNDFDSVGSGVEIISGNPTITQMGNVQETSPGVWTLVGGSNGGVVMTDWTDLTIRVFGASASGDGMQSILRHTLREAVEGIEMCAGSGTIVSAVDAAGNAYDPANAVFQ